MLNQIARILFLKRQYTQAIGYLQRVCDVDPEDVQMHYTAMLCYRGLGDPAATGKKYLPETLVAGCAFIDLDGDGWPDILCINGKDFTASGQRSLPTLYRNNHNGAFTDITHGSVLDVEMYGMGVAVADYDNDGRPDIYQSQRARRGGSRGKRAWETVADGSQRLELLFAKRLGAYVRFVPRPGY